MVAQKQILCLLLCFFIYCVKILIENFYYEIDK